MRLHSWLELFSSRLRYLSRLRGRGRRKVRPTDPRSLRFEKLEERVLLSAPQPFELGTLDGVVGFTLEGATIDDRAGWSIRSAGDINNDGYDDLILTAPFGEPGGNVRAGHTYVLLGKQDWSSTPVIDLTDVSGIGFRIDGQVANLNPNTANPLITATGIGDFNGDGIADIAVSQPGAINAGSGASNNSGRIYVLWGGTTAMNNAITSGTFSLTPLENATTVNTFGGTGIRIQGSQPQAANVAIGQQAGYAISNIGDIDGDGYNDLLIGSHRWDAETGANSNDFHGRAYVIYGKSVGTNTGSPAGWQAQSLVNLGGLGTNGFSFDVGTAANERGHRVGFAVTSLGDINGDGRADIAISAPYAGNTFGDGGTGRVYVVFGNARGTMATSTTSLNGANGFRIDGVMSNDNAGWSISGAGDVNGDGYDDFVIGTPYADPAGKTSAGAAYVIFGRSGFTDLPGNILDLRTLNGANGFRLEGQYAGDLAGWSVAGGGDIDGDGFDDIIIGAPGYGSYTGNSSQGRIYVIFGRKTQFDPEHLLKDFVDDTLLNPTPDITRPTHLGFSLDGVAPGDRAGTSLSLADVNGDGLYDILIGAPLAYSTVALGDAGGAYVFFGQTFRPDGPGLQTGGTGPDDISALDDPDPFDRDRLIGGDGNDVLRSNGGPDVMIGGRGNDFFYVTDTNFFIPTGVETGDPFATRRIDGGLGRDTVVFQVSDTTIDLTAIPNNRIKGIEVIDIRGTGNTLIVNVLEVRNLSPTTNTLVVRRSIGNVVRDAAGALPAGGWQKLYDVVDDNFGSSTYGVTFEVYSQGSGLGVTFLLVEDPAVLNLRQLDGFDPNNPDDEFTSGPQPNGHPGVALTGESSGDSLGGSTQGARQVAGVGDVNGDGFDDFLLAAYGSDVNGNNSGAIYLVFGQGGVWSPTLSLGAITGDNAVRLNGIDGDDLAGLSVAALGDVDGDGLADFIISAHRADRVGPVDTSEGEAYVVFGKTFQNWTSSDGPEFELSSLNGTDGYVLRGNRPNDFAGFAVGGGGDINGDGYDDIIVTAWQADLVTGFETSEGSTYVLFGGLATLFQLDEADGVIDGKIDIQRVDGLNGFRIDGVTANDHSGRAVSIAGDFNGDGFADLLIGARGVDANPGSSTTTDEGAAYLVFGKADWSATPVFSLGDVNGVNGVRFNGEAAGDWAGWSVSFAGDVNGDGFDDIIIGSYLNDVAGNASGRAYIVFGRANWAAVGTAGFDLASINGTNGFRINGFRANDFAGFSVTGIGDFNGDGYDDVVIGAPRDNAHSSINNVSWSFPGGGPTPTSGTGDTGQLYLVFGKADWSTTPTFLPDAIDGLNGIRIDGIGSNNFAGSSVSYAGDVNGDGFKDIIIGARGAGSAGTAYLVFGGSYPGTAAPQRDHTGDVTLTAVNGSDVDQLIGGTGNDTLISDGGNDVLYGGEGDDLIILPDVNFSGPRRIDGGNGVDTLKFGEGVSGAHLNLAQIADNRIQNIEIIDITGDPNNPATLPTQTDNTLSVSVKEIQNLSAIARGRQIGNPLASPDVSLSNTLTVLRNYGDVVNILDPQNWDTSSAAIFDPIFGQYFNTLTSIPHAVTDGYATLHIQNVNISINGGVATVYGTSGDDVFIYDAITNELIVSLNGGAFVTYDLDDPALAGFTAVTSVVVNGFGGTDRVELRGTALDDYANVGLTTVAGVFGNGRSLSGTSIEISSLDGRGQVTADTLTLIDAGQTLDLTQGHGALNRGLEIINITGTGNNHLVLGHNAAVANDALADTLTVLRNTGDTVSFIDRPPLWSLDPFAEWDAGRNTFFERYEQSGELVRVQSVQVQMGVGTAYISGTNLDNVITYDVSTHIVTIDGVAYDLNLPGGAPTVAIDAMAGNDSLTVFASAGDDHVTLTPGAAHVAFSNGFLLLGSSVETVVVLGQGGNDTGTLHGTDFADSFTASPTVATLQGPGTFQQLQNFSTVTAFGGAGADVAQLEDSAGNDVFTANPNSANLAGTGFSNTVFGFETVSAIANAGGNDIARLTGSAGNDAFTGRQTISTLSGTGYSLTANQFDLVVADGAGGAEDSATFFDTAGNDTFIGRKGDSVMSSNNVRYLQALNFERVIARSTAGGDDNARLNDSDKNDTFIAREGLASMAATNFLLRVEGFRHVLGRAGNGGTDTAYLYDNGLNNQFYGQPSQARFDGGGLDLIARLFPTVYAQASGGTDTATFFDGAGRETLTAGPTGIVMQGPAYRHELKGFDGVQASSTAGGIDKAILTGSSGNDTFVGRQFRSILTTRNFSADVRQFEIVEVVAVAGGNDQATLFDSPGQDTYFGSGTIGRLFGNGFSYQVDLFTSVVANGRAGGVNRLNLSDISYLFNTVGTWV